MGYHKTPWLSIVIILVLSISLRTLFNTLRLSTLRLDIKPLDRNKFETLRQVIGVILYPRSSLAFLVLVVHRSTFCDHSSLLPLFSMFFFL